jgi:hypothetical protein
VIAFEIIQIQSPPLLSHTREHNDFEWIINIKDIPTLPIGSLDSLETNFTLTVCVSLNVTVSRVSQQANLRINISDCSTLVNLLCLLIYY